jgi:hypothetical protein
MALAKSMCALSLIYHSVIATWLFVAALGVAELA